MDNLKLQELSVIVLSDAATSSASANQRGHLFELFAARLLELFGYGEVKTENLNVTSEGIEIDLVATHTLTKKRAIIECKSYASNVAAKEMLAFLGKLMTERHDDPSLEGYFICLPKLTQPGVEKARANEKQDNSFHYFDAQDVHSLLVQRGVLGPDPAELTELVTSDRTVVITEHGVYTALKRLDNDSRMPTEVLIWSANGSVPEPVMGLVRSADFVGGLPCRAYQASGNTVTLGRVDQPEDLVIQVRGGSSDFEYQLPAAPKFFVGRRATMDALAESIGNGSRVIVVNAQSGWGKSSLALRLRQSVESAGGVALVLDSRTVNRPTYVASALRVAAEAAEKAGVLQISADASWASLASSMRTLESSTWASESRRLLVMFDQFENVFREEAVTREFRDLAVLASETSIPFLVGFAWKTDVVGWTEGYPYQLRDSIRQNAYVVNLEPLGPNEIGTLLRRLEKALESSLLSELKVKLREYSQGLPWLTKKLGSHVISESKRGISQEDLVSEALNVQRLFENDLQELQPTEREALNWLAKYAPVLLSEALERFSAPVVQSLLDRRLIVQVGERLDTYWDIFRDYLTTGRVPIEDSYTLRMYPATVGRLLQVLHDRSEPVLSTELAALLGWSENVLANAVREARVLGLVRSQDRRIALVKDDDATLDVEEAIRARVSSALKRHKVFTTYLDLAERAGGRVTLQQLAGRLPTVFPAIAASGDTWMTYTRAFAKWFDYAKIATFLKQELADVPPERTTFILDAQVRSRTPGAFPQRPPGPALQFLVELAAAPGNKLEASRVGTGAGVRDLLALGLAFIDEAGMYELAIPMSVTSEGEFSPEVLLGQILAVPGGTEAVAMLQADPKATPAELGALLRDAQSVEWSDGTTALAGKHFRAWANRAGVFTGKGARRPKRRTPEIELK